MLMSSPVVTGLQIASAPLKPGTVLGLVCKSTDSTYDSKWGLYRLRCRNVLPKAICTIQANC